MQSRSLGHRAGNCDARERTDSWKYVYVYVCVCVCVCVCKLFVDVRVYM